MEDNNIQKEIASINEQLADIRKEIMYSVAPKFLELSVEVNDLVELAIDYWRLEHRLGKMFASMEKNQKENLESSLQRIKRYLDKNDVEIIDHTNQKYDEGQNLEILAVEHDPKAKENTIKETKEPTVLLKGQVIHIGKIIVTSREKSEVEE